MKKGVLITLGLLALIASAVMYFVGKDSSHLSELYDVFWIPLPLAAACFGVVALKKD
jgi:hypothetical protein